jgi:hypothetical protein
MIHEIMLRDRFRAYKDLFFANGEMTESGKRVLADLKKFCRADRSTHIPGDPYSSAVAEGRREVYLRLCSFLHLSEKDFFNLKEELPSDDGTSGTRRAVTHHDAGEFD